MSRLSTAVSFARCVSALLLSACSPPADVARHTVPQYRADFALREQQLAACADDPGTLRNTPDCVNAREAKRLEETHSLRENPSLDLYSEPHQPAGDKTPDKPSAPQ